MERFNNSGFSFITLLLLYSFSMFSCGRSREINGVFIDFKQADKVRKEIKKENPDFLPAFNHLIGNAEKAMDEGPFSVIQKKRTPPSGDKHDYLSMGPYWWPDPNKPDGLPYIRKDGEVNPEARGEYVDQPAKSKLFQNVESLGWAFYFTGEKKYAKKAVELLENWFVNAETRMNPNLNYAQGIPGICDGRGIGIIDFSRIDMLLSPIQILDAAGMFTNETRKEIISWFNNYLNWLLTSNYGTDEDKYFNNHGTWYDVQVVGISIWLGKTEQAKKRLDTISKSRIVSQIEKDGSQPHELARTKSLSYSAMNLLGFSYLANLGQKTGVDLWNFETQDGISIKKAYKFLLPFVNREKQWEYPQITDAEGSLENLRLNFHVAASRTGDPFYRQVSQAATGKAMDIKVLLFPIFD